MKRIACIVALCLPLFAARSAMALPTTRPVPAIERAVIISIDGLRPDLLLRANAPNIRRLYESGSFSFWARTTAVSITLPSHTSMLTGLTPRRHEIEWNRDLPLTQPIYPKGQTLFEVAKHAGYSTAMAAGKAKFTALSKPQTLDWEFIPHGANSEDPNVADRAIEIIRQHQPQVLFVHLPSVDNVGHAIGWATPQQLEAIAGADASVERILAAIDRAGVREHTFILLTADHGGAGKTHGPDDPRSRHIPWIASGPGIRRNLDLTTYPKLIINTEDTFATVCFLLAIPYDRTIDGRPVTEIIDRKELLHPVESAAGARSEASSPELIPGCDGVSR